MITRSCFRAVFVAAFVLLGAAVTHAQQTMQTWLMLNQVSEETCFVNDPAEYARLAGSGWRINGVVGILPKAHSNTLGMQRWVKGFEKGSDRIFAVTAEQAAVAKKTGYANEGTMGQVGASRLAPSMIPVYHFTKNSRNLWLVDKADQPWAEKLGWKLEGVAFWVWPKPAS